MSIRKYLVLVPMIVAFAACGGEATPEPETPEGAATPETPAAAPEEAPAEEAPAAETPAEGAGEAAPAE